MGKSKKTDASQDLRTVLYYNQQTSQDLLSGVQQASSRASADECIASSQELLRSLGYGEQVDQISDTVPKVHNLQNRPVMKDWSDIVDEAHEHIQHRVEIEDLLSPEEIALAFSQLNSIEAEFSKKTSIINKTDLTFLAVATGLQVAKSLIFPYIAKNFGYGDSFDPADRLAHDDPSIKKKQKDANDTFRDKHQKNHENKSWINLLYQTPPYDTTVGSSALGINMEGKYHRMHTLGHDPILGWLFGTANILTDVITLNDFRSFRVTRKPKIKITSTPVSLGNMFQESYASVKEDFLNLPAAVFAQAQHFKSDKYTKTGLPIPVLSAFNENFASNLYKNQYDSLCFSRDVKIVGASYVVSLLIDTIIGIVHGLFRKPDENQKLYEVRTRKILLISNSIASASSIVNACITSNPKNLDIGGLLSTISHLFFDIKFILKIKQEFIEKEIYKSIQAELDEIDRIWNTI